MMNIRKETGKKTAATFRKVLTYIGRYRILLFLSLLLAAASVVLQLYIPILFGRAIDCIVSPGEVDFATLTNLAGRIVILLAAAALSTWLMNLINNRLTYRTVQDIRAKAIRQIQNVPLSYLDAGSEGDIVQRVIADVDQLSDGLLMGFTQLFSGVVMIVMTLVFMLMRSVPISVMVIVLTPVSFLIARFIAKHSFAMFRKQTDVRGQQTALISEMVGNEKIVRAFNYGARASKRFEAINRELQEYSVKAIFFSSLTNPCTRAVNAVIFKEQRLGRDQLVNCAGCCHERLAVLAQRSADSFMMFSRSAGEKPAVDFATWLRFTSSASGLFLECILSISSLALTSGR